MLPNPVGAPVYGSLQSFVNALGGILLHFRHHVAVKVERHPDSGMPEPLAGDLRMHSVAKQMCCVGMP